MLLVYIMLTDKSCLAIRGGQASLITIISKMSCWCQLTGLTEDSINHYHYSVNGLMPAFLKRSSP